MRFFEFKGDDATDKLIVVLRNYIGRASSKKSPAKLNWAGLNHIFSTAGVELAADYETFKSMYDSNPAIQALVSNFNQDGIELKVPGAAPADQEQSPVKNGETSQDAVDKAAASAAPQQLAQSTASLS